nr:type IX secretion system sortase PorU [Flavihumibacter profundi]
MDYVIFDKPMMCCLKNVCVFLFLSASLSVRAQRSYAGHSVLATGNWYKLAVTQAGVYKIDGAFLQQLGLSLPVPSAKLQVFGRNGLPPGEACSSPYTDDLQEMPVIVHDGNDGNFNNTDYLVFYASGPHGWKADTANQRFSAVHNIYSDTAYIYFTLGNATARISTDTVKGIATDTITSYQFRYHYEKDLYNLLSSGKEWYGERFLAESPAILSLALKIPFPVPGSTASLVSAAAARSVDAASSFQLDMNGAALLTQAISPVTSSNLDQFARENSQEAQFSPLPDNQLSYSFQPGNSSAIGWINYFDCFAQSQLSLQAGLQLDFRSWLNTGSGRLAEYRVANASASTRVWRVSNGNLPVQVAASLKGANLVFTDLHEKAEEYLAFEDDPAQLPVPVIKGLISNQDLHGTAIPQMIVVTTPALLPAANRLASWHQQHDALNSLVVTTEQVYQEFSAGQVNPTAIRDFVKMYYDRAGKDSSLRPRYLLLFGDASYDYKNRVPGNNAGVPAYESSSSLDPLTTYVSDDYYGFLEDTEDINSVGPGLQLDIGIGRIPAPDLEGANNYIDKIVLYHQPAARGDWRNVLSFIADDEDFNLHLRDAEEITGRVKSVNDLFQLDKIYLDAYQQESDAAGSRYPLVNQAISDRMQKGTLIWNFNGHGGFRRLAEEVVLDQGIVDGWQQNGRLPLFITATCDFAPYDNPSITSLGEYLILKPAAGAIALMTTTRLVFAFSNRIMNSNYLAVALQPLPDGHYRSLGEAVKAAKNLTYQGSSDVFNNLKFTLLGDPAVSLAFPKYQVITTSVNGKAVSSGVDSLQALEEITVAGLVADGQGQIRADFNGLVFPQVLDKPYKRRTLANDPGSIAEDFIVQDQYLFKGKATVKDGRFSFSFVVPKDLNYAAGLGAIRYYAQDSLTDAAGVFDQLPIGGSALPPADLQGPAISAWLNDTNFRNGGLTDETPLLLLKLADSSGINVLGNGIGHDVTVIIDGNIQAPLVLNSFFETETDTYKRGSVQFRLPVLADGDHVLTIKAWDVVNNSSTVNLNFRVKNSGKLVVESVLAWPNPSTGNVRFGINHNQGNELLQAVVELFSISGHMVKTIHGTIIGNGNRSYIDWNGRDDRGNLVPPGVYVYRIIITTANGQQAFVVKKLIRI